MSALPIFPVRLQTSIFGADELNFRVRDGNGWTLIAINTDSLFFEKKSKQKKLQHFLLLTVLFNDKSLYSIWTPLSSPKNRGKGGDPCGNRTHVCGVRGRRLSRLTNGPSRRTRYLPAPSKPNNAEFRTRQAPAFIFLRSSPRRISIGQLHTLPCFHLRPINVIVYDAPYSTKDERSYLRGSFTLRCLQRLSRPDIATQLCRWHDNWCTRGLSIPVLSY